MFLVLAVPIIAESALAKPNDLPVQAKVDVIAVMGTGHIQGESVIVEILVEVPQGENANQVASDVLKANNLRPFDSAGLGSDGFTVTGFFWPSHGMTQLYNPANQEDSNTKTLLEATHSDWNGVGTSDFTFSYGGVSAKCPSMVKECPGPQVFDFENTVGWLDIKSRGTLAIAYFAVHSEEGPETDIALNTRYSWNGECNENLPNIIDIETVLRHENGHAAGIGHSENATALMAPYYSGPNCELNHPDDKEAITYLYDNSITGSVTGIVTNGTHPISGVTVTLEGTSLSATNSTGSIVTILDVPNPVTYTIIASAPGFDSESKRVSVDEGETIIIFNLKASESDDGGNGGGPPACHPRFGC